MTPDQAVNYRVRLRALDWASQLLRELAHSEDADAVAIAVSWALDATYDLSEARWIGRAPKPKIPAQDELLADPADPNPSAHINEIGGEVVGGLLAARASKTHHVERFDARNPFIDLPYDFASLTNWVWSNRPTARLSAHLDRRVDWYMQHVAHRPLWVPLDEASYWFISHAPADIPSQDRKSVRGWVSGVSPVLYQHADWAQSSD